MDADIFPAAVRSLVRRRRNERHTFSREGENEMKLTEDAVFRIEQNLIRDTDLWYELENQDRNIELLTYISGINDMAQAIVRVLKEPEGMNDA